MLIGNDSPAGMPVSGERAAWRSTEVPAEVAFRVLRGGVRAHMEYFDWQVAGTSIRLQDRPESGDGLQRCALLSGSAI